MYYDYEFLFVQLCKYQYQILKREQIVNITITLSTIKISIRL